jgi:hypothetical protein
MELPDHLHAQIVALCSRGDESADQGDFSTALEKYWAAWDLLPETKTDWEAATWILTAIGDANFRSGDFEAGRANLSNAMRCPDAIGKPFIHLRLGQCQFETGNLKRAADELARAFLLEGLALFEDEDPKYIEWIKPQLKEPKNGWPEGY